MVTVGEKYRTLIALAPDPIFLIDISDGRIAEANESAAALLGYDISALTGIDVATIHPPEQRDDYRELLEQTVDRGQCRTATLADGTQLFLVTRDGTHVPVELHTRTIDVDGKTWVYSIVRDVTEQYENACELQRQNERLEEFTAVVSHDLRNPLNVADLHLELAREECDSDHLDNVAGAVERMETLIEDLLSLAREGETVNDVEPVDIGALTEQCWQNVATDGASLQTTGGELIRADPLRLRQLVENLFRNSIEQAEGDVTITVGLLDDRAGVSGGDDRAGFYVEDDGPGIPEDRRDAVFEPGYTTTVRGTGLGLNIVKQIVEAHGWDIGVTDGTDGGARFEITGIEGH